MGTLRQVISVATLLTVASTTLVGCGGGQKNYRTGELPLGGLPNSNNGSLMQKMQTGHLSNGQKAALLAGSAALYYLYKKNHEMAKQGVNVPHYYLSANGRVYYRGPRGQVNWVTAPPQGIQVPAQEAYQYRNFEGYEGQPTGRNLVGITRGHVY